MSSNESSPSKTAFNLNPLKVDEDLKGLLDKLLTVQSPRTFDRWRQQFLRLFESYLEQDGIDKAHKSNEDFTNETVLLASVVNKVQKNTETGALSKESVTVKGRNSLNELNKVMTNCVNSLQRFVPSTRSEEKELGYSKFQMGAVLVRDGFTIYGRLSMISSIAKSLREGALAEVADKQILEMIDYFDLCFRRFCDLMADLGLYEFMLKAQQFAGMTEDGRDNLVIFVDLKTGSIGELHRDDCFKKGMLTLTTDKNGRSVILEAAIDEEDRQDLIDMLKAKLKL
jgi:hypothetical protein